MKTLFAVVVGTSLLMNPHQELDTTIEFVKTEWTSVESSIHDVVNRVYDKLTLEDMVVNEEVVAEQVEESAAAAPVEAVEADLAVIETAADDSAELSTEDDESIVAVESQDVVEAGDTLAVAEDVAETVEVAATEQNAIAAAADQSEPVCEEVVAEEAVAEEVLVEEVLVEEVLVEEVAVEEVVVEEVVVGDAVVDMDTLIVEQDVAAETFPAELQQLADAWPQLNEHTRASILMLIQADQQTQN